MKFRSICLKIIAYSVTVLVKTIMDNCNKYQCSADFGVILTLQNQTFSHIFDQDC